MYIQSFPLPPLSTNAYVAAFRATHEALLIDAPLGAYEAVSAYLKAQELILKGILLTHSHWDHIAGAKLCKDQWQVPLYVHPLDAPNLRQPGADKLPLWLSIEGVNPDQALEEGQKMTLGKLCFEVMHTPGHSPGCICLYEPQQQVLFSGDTLFKGSFGNVSFPSSQPTSMWSSLARLAGLPPATRVFPGHGPSTTIQAEKEWLVQAEELYGH